MKQPPRGIGWSVLIGGLVGQLRNDKAMEFITVRHQKWFPEQIAINRDRLISIAHTIQPCSKARFLFK
ncbi:hypothetical protein Sinac_2819 [Singulisphaera acidiphila DSM 18658]|uniref:Uncharacterized protein n=1 Tax=Singulisphaera acidiphila (strain ATCC BAA-1392 / DSM 18658 / VKM B-2454 / MOB10) TaxID=886293 RepID=L0DEM1_SINAD|nr:hypothetical protein Sinac_2819 [Singulisphaera acidiphila DSM 18658]